MRLFRPLDGRVRGLVGCLVVCLWSVRRVVVAWLVVPLRPEHDEIVGGRGRV